MYENGDSSFIHVPRAETDGSSGDVMSSVIKTLAPVITHFRAGKTGCHETLHFSPFSSVLSCFCSCTWTVHHVVASESSTKVHLDKSPQHNRAWSIRWVSSRRGP